MDCEAIKELIGPGIDRQLSPAESAVLEAHLSMCEECRAASESLRALDADLLRAFQPHRQAAGEVAARVLQAMREDLPPVAAAPAPRARPRWWPLLASAAAGFLLATMIYQPWNKYGWLSQNVSPGPIRGGFHHRSNLPQVQWSAPPAASLVATTGDVEMCDTGNTAWRPVASQTPLLPNCTVRTGPLVQCELKTADGCIVRLNRGTQITLKSADQIEIAEGQIWCSAPQDKSLQVTTVEAPPLARPQPLWSPQVMTCPSMSSSMAQVHHDGGLQVTAAEGVTELKTSAGKETLTRGESASIVDNKIIKSSQRSDMILTTSWIHPLLMHKRDNSAELDDRVNKLLASLGRSKLEHLYEREIRGLGEYAALPLIRYLQLSPADEPARRQKALQILSDIAPTWAIPELISLLSNGDADTRFYAAQALERLTGQDQGRTPDQWREDLKECQPTIELWQQWKQGNVPPTAPVERKT